MAFLVTSRIVRLVVAGCLVGAIVAVAFGIGWGPHGRSGAADEQDGQVVPRLDAASAARVARGIDAYGGRRDQLSACPADVWRRRTDLSRRGSVTPKACAAKAEDCLADCLDFSSRRSCFSLARVMEKTRGVDPLYAQMLYTLACASGAAAGCVNRAAGLRNGDYAEEPFSRDVATRQACETRSFAIGCDAGQAWGCAMRGQALELGEGSAPDAAAARQDYAKACTLAPTFAACRFAKEREAEMETPKTKTE